MPYDPNDSTFEPAEREVRTTAQSVLAARLHTGHPGFWPGADIDLHGAYLIGPNFNSITAGMFDARGATFSRSAMFDGATFTGIAIFAEATFDGDAWFDRATFSGGAEFSKAKFKELATFDQATFTLEVSFRKTTFSGTIDFRAATFSRAHPPMWPDGFAEPAGIRWEPDDPSTPTPSSPNPPAPLTSP